MNKIRKSKIREVVLPSALALSLFSQLAWAQSKGQPLVRGNCRIIDRDENPNQAEANEALLGNIWYDGAAYHYCPDCSNGSTTANAYPWEDDFTKLPQGDGETELQGARCLSVPSPTGPDVYMRPNAIFPPTVECTNNGGALNADYFTEECVDFDKTALDLVTIIAIALGAAAFVFLVVGIVCVICVRKRTQKAEQEKADKTAKVIVLDAPAPPPLYDADHDVFDGYVKGDEDDEYTKHLRAMKSQKSMRNSPYADPNQAQSDPDIEMGLYNASGRRSKRNVNYSRKDMERYGVPGNTDNVGYGEAFGSGEGRAPARRQYGSYGEGALARPDVNRHDDAVSYGPRTGRRRSVPAVAPSAAASASSTPARRRVNSLPGSSPGMSRPDVNRHDKPVGYGSRPARRQYGSYGDPNQGLQRPDMSRYDNGRGSASKPAPQVPWMTTGAAVAGGAAAGAVAGGAVARSRSTSQIHRSGSKRISREDSWEAKERKEEMKRREAERVEKEREARDKRDRRHSAPSALPDEDEMAQLGTSKSLRQLQQQQMKRAKSEENFHNPYTYGYGTGTSQGDQSYQTQDYPRSQMVF